MSHEPTVKEVLTASKAAFAANRGPMTAGLTAANRIRDARIRAEALEEAAALFDGHAFGVARVIRALKDKEP
jgi:hypothetical protein